MTAVVVRLRIVGLERDRPVVARQRFRGTLQERQRVGQMAMGGGDVGVQPNRLPDQLDRPLRSLRLSGDHAKQMQGIEVIWLQLQNVRVNALRLSQLSLLMQRQPLPEHGLQ